VPSVSQTPVDQHATVKAKLLAALDLPPLAREAYVSDLDRDDPVAARRVRQLLDAHHRAGTFLDVPDEDVGALPEDVPATPPVPVGARIGLFTVEREIGRGGMGTVLLGSRDEAGFTQRVALKIIRGARYDASAAARLVEERRILAGLNHPSIAHFVDGGTTPDGLPYLAMEFVAGTPITDYCDAHGLTIRQRIRLFLKVCDAVHFAHQRLVVHRDIKPSNILVTSEGLPKLLDFGIAKLADPLHTSSTATVCVLTPHYASPEQASGGPVTTISDVYSLGVLVYEMVTGTGPYRSVSADSAPLAVLDAIRREPVERPSLAAGRGGRGPLDPDLEAILLKALRKDEADRYGSVEQLAKDLARYLDGRPVEARAGSRTYLTRKFIGRHRGAVAAAAAVVLAIGAGGAATAWQASVARQQRALAESRFRQVQEFSRSLLFDVHTSLRRVPGATEARRLLLDRAVTFLDGLAADAGNDHAFKLELAAGYQRLADVQGNPVSENVGDSAAALVSIDKAGRLVDDVRAASPDDADALQRAIEIAFDRANAPALGEDDTLAAEARHAALVAELDSRRLTAARAVRTLAKAYSDIGVLRTGRNDFEGAEHAYRRAVRLFASLAPGERDVAAAQHGFALKRLGGVLLRRQRLDESEGYYRQALAIDEAVLKRPGVDDRDRYAITFTLSDLGLVLSRRGRWDDAVALWTDALARRKAISDADPKDVRAVGGVATLYGRLGYAAQARGDVATAVSYYRWQLALREQLLESQSGSPATNRAERNWAALSLAEALGLQGQQAPLGPTRRSWFAEGRRLVQGVPRGDGTKTGPSGSGSAFLELHDRLTALFASGND
jgi:tetratricopeptide (TPR) repeat protein/tRNA A-37 threonylcarbamoyl transferase component Bud32